VQYVPGQGEEIGRALVCHPAVRLIMFTGSKAVGLSIIQQAAVVQPAQRFVKQVVVEMGGKNAILVDEDADLDAAIHGSIVSAFRYQGQKCSAASRLIVHDAVFQPLIERLIGAVDGLIVRDPISPNADMGPLIDADAQRRVTTAIARGEESATLLYRYPTDRVPPEGYFVGPAVFTDVDLHSPLAQEELFGPVLCCFRVRSFEDALTLANDTDYGLTGGIYSRSPSHLRRAIEVLDVGNLYVNRPITGAMVGRQPFGGAKLSGLGTKAGGPDYLQHLLIPKTISEDTTRHGIPLD
ncbi:MAG: aldehyde dehydrogenase family protein, partial [Candidatus Omnitrophica bacterium]|nr:aldehyde dehydrogenase family protein [Candidatus Omnitrophota bacterium]